MSSTLRTIGHRKERPITFSASADLLVEGARFNDDIHRMPTGNLTIIKKGVFFFKTHIEANQQQQDSMIESVVQAAMRRP